MRRYVQGLLAGVLALLVLGSGCIGEAPQQVKSGDAVRVHYTGTFENGTVFDSSAGREPLGFTVGAGRVVPGFAAGVLGMQVGETKTFHIPADRAYGPYREDLVFVVDPAEISGGENLAVGQRLGITLQNGLRLAGTVTNVSPEAVTVDANHRLAGEDLTFTVRIVEIE